MLLVLSDYKVRDWGYLVLLIPGIWGIFYALTADVFIDQADTPMTEEHIEKLGMKATPRNRAIVFILALSMMAFALWKMFEP